MTLIWTPSGMRSPQVRRLQKLLNEYDERLDFERNQYYEWVVTMKMPRGEDPLPVLNFGKEIPDPEAAMQRVHKADTVRTGEAVLDSINKHNADKEAARQYEMRQLDGMMAEVMESAAHRYGGTRYHRSLPKKDPKQKGD